MRPIRSCATSSPIPPTSLPKKRRWPYVLVGCGCITVSVVLLLILGIFVLGAANIDDAKSSAGTTLHHPGKKRVARARQAAERYLDALEQNQTTRAWQMTSSGFRKATSQRVFTTIASNLHKVGAVKKRYLTKTEVDTVKASDGRKLGADKFTYEYRNGRERRVFTCLVRVHDRKVLDERDNDNGGDFEILALRCHRTYVTFRKAWGDKPRGKLAKYGSSLTDMTNNGWPSYPMPHFDADGAAGLIRQLRSLLVHRHYAKAAGMMSANKKAGSTKPDDMAKFVKLLGRSALERAKIKATEAHAAKALDTWLRNAVDIEHYPVRLILPPRRHVERTLIFEVQRRWDHGKPKGKQAGRFYIEKLTLSTRVVH